MENLEFILCRQVRGNRGAPCKRSGRRAEERVVIEHQGGKPDIPAVHRCIEAAQHLQALHDAGVCGAPKRSGRIIRSREWTPFHAVPLSQMQWRCGELISSEHPSSEWRSGSRLRPGRREKIVGIARRIVARTRLLPAQKWG